MNWLSGVFEVASDLLPTAVVVAAVVIGLGLANRLMERSRRLSEGRRFRQQMMMVGLTLVGLLAVVMVLPVDPSLRGDLLGLIGILLSAAIALSSTTILGNGLAGLMLRGVRNFRMGDFIRVGEYFGRVSERGLFHTEIQTEDRELITLPNLYLVTHPVATVRSSGTIISATVSLGYDIPRPRVEQLLREAAEACGLQDPFVHTMELGDFSVTYRVAGLLGEVKQLITARSRLRSSMMDALHGGGVEIVSPNVMNQRVFPVDKQFVPKAATVSGEAESVGPLPEDLAFDKAEMAESQEIQLLSHDKLVELIAELDEEIKKSEDEAEKKKLENRRARLEARRQRLAESIQEAQAATEQE